MNCWQMPWVKHYEVKNVVILIVPPSSITMATGCHTVCTFWLANSLYFYFSLSLSLLSVNFCLSHSHIQSQ